MMARGLIGREAASRFGLTGEWRAALAALLAQANCNGKGLCWSDLRLKRNAELITHLDNGLDLYRYSYNWSDRLYVGVMAQDVARLAPEAVMRRGWFPAGRPSAPRSADADLG
jgi:hypothetical protein